MTRLFGKRSIENPAVPLTSAKVLAYLGIGAGTDAGVSVTPANACSSTAVWAAINLISGAIGTLPVGVYRKSGEGREAVSPHAITRLLDLEPNTEMTGQVFREAVTFNVMMYGVGYAAVVRDGNAMPRELIPMSSACTRVERRGGVCKVITLGAGGREVEMRPIDVLILPGLTTDGLAALSPIVAGKEAIGTGLAAQTFGGSFFSRGAQLGGVLEHPGAVSPEAAGRLRESWDAVHGGAGNAHKTAVLEEGMKYNQVGVDPDKAQFLETRKFQVTEVARIFGVPPHMIADLDRATFSNIEHQAISFVQYALNRWVVRWEKETARKLLTEREKAAGNYVKLNVSSLMRGDSAARSTYLTTMVGGGIMKINEARSLEDLNPVDGGDELLVPANNLAPLSQVGQEPEGDPAPEPVADPEENSVRSEWVTDTIRRLVGEESRLVTNAARKHLLKNAKPDVAGFSRWVADYYEKFRAKAAEALTGPSGDTAGDVAERHATKSRAQIEAIIREVEVDDLADAIVERMDEWKTTRWQDAGAN